MPAPNLISAESISKTYGTRTILDHVSLGIGQGDVIGVVGRNGDGKSTLLRILTGQVEPDDGKVTRTSNLSVGTLLQDDQIHLNGTVRDLVADGQPDHVWARDSHRRQIVNHLLGSISFDSEVSSLSGGERRRCFLVKILIADHDLLVLDEPTNHLDVEAISWLAHHLVYLHSRGTAMLIVSHDRWFLDEVATRIWEVHDASVEAYDGGYAAYILARAERDRQAASREARRKNLVRKELAWLRRGAPARTSKPRYRVDAANALIADVPEPRDRLQLQQFSASRLGKDVIDCTAMSLRLGERTLFDSLTWSIGPGDRIGLIGVNGCGKSTLLRILAKTQQPSAGKVKHGLTLRLGFLSQTLSELDPSEQVLSSVNRLRERTRLATGKDVLASTLLEDFGFTGTKLVTAIGDLSGGERRRLQVLRLLIEQPNVLILDEPTNDLDIDTLTVIEDYLDTWPGTLIVASHDRYFLERITDVIYAITDDGNCVLLPGGIDQYLDSRRQANAPSSQKPAGSKTRSSSAEQRVIAKKLARLESQMNTVETRIRDIEHQMAQAATDYHKLTELQEHHDQLTERYASLETEWMDLAQSAE